MRLRFRTLRLDRSSTELHPIEWLTCTLPAETAFVCFLRNEAKLFIQKSSPPVNLTNYNLGTDPIMALPCIWINANAILCTIVPSRLVRTLEFSKQKYLFTSIARSSHRCTALPSYDWVCTPACRGCRTLCLSIPPCRPYYAISLLYETEYPE